MRVVTVNLTRAPRHERTKTIDAKDARQAEVVPDVTVSSSVILMYLPFPSSTLLSSTPASSTPTSPLTLNSLPAPPTFGSNRPIFINTSLDLYESAMWVQFHGLKH